MSFPFDSEHRKRQINEQKLSYLCSQQIEKSSQSSNDEQEQLLYSNCGLIVSKWKNQPFENYYGTAFSVSQNTIITTTSNIYSQKLKCFADSVTYYPYLDYNIVFCLNAYQTFNQTHAPYYSVLETDILNLRLYSSTTKNIALLGLSTNLNLPKYLPIGNIKRVRREIKIIGYPSYQYSKQTTEFKKIYAWRGEIECQYIYIRQNTIDYKMIPVEGMSGAPLVSKNYKGEYFVIGINTNQYSSWDVSRGIYFSQQVIETIQHLSQKLCANFNLRNQITIDCFQSALLRINPAANLQGDEELSSKYFKEESENSDQSNSSVIDDLELLQFLTFKSADRQNLSTKEQ